MINPIPADEMEYLAPFANRDGVAIQVLIELGNKKNAQGIYKDYFENELGITHISIDWNGEDGAIQMDLREEIIVFKNKADMVTNIGTTEHVSSQAGVWENIHNFCRVGGVVVSITPYPDGRNWWWHGEWYPTESFFEQFASKNGYEIIKIGQGREEPNKNLCVRMEKVVHKPFHMPEKSTMYYNKIRPRGERPII